MWETAAAELIEEIEESDEDALSDELQEEMEGEGKAGEVESGLKGFETLGLPVNSLGQSLTAGEFGSERQVDKARLLAEKFAGYLGAMARFFNHYLLIPAGRYVFGSKTTGADELLDKIVELDTFYIGRFPVTNALFEIFVEKTGYRTTAEKKGFGTVYKGRYSAVSDPGTGRRSLSWQSAVTVKKVEGACWFQPSGPGSTLHNKRNHPVVQISLQDASAFAAWTGNAFRPKKSGKPQAGHRKAAFTRGAMNGRRTDVISKNHGRGVPPRWTDLFPAPMSWV